MIVVFGFRVSGLGFTAWQVCHNPSEQGFKLLPLERREVLQQDTLALRFNASGFFQHGQGGGCQLHQQGSIILRVRCADHPSALLECADKSNHGGTVNANAVGQARLGHWAGGLKHDHHGKQWRGEFEALKLVGKEGVTDSSGGGKGESWAFGQGWIELVWQWFGSVGQWLGFLVSHA
jgi:hypothetical protein